MLTALVFWTYGFGEPCAIVMVGNDVEGGPAQLTALLLHADEGSIVALNPETGATPPRKDR